jgi:hypothetical protein
MGAYTSLAAFTDSTDPNGSLHAHWKIRDTAARCRCYHEAPARSDRRALAELPPYSPLVEAGAHIRQVDIHDITQRFGGIVRDADGGDVTLHLPSFVL